MLAALGELSEITVRHLPPRSSVAAGIHTSQHPPQRAEELMLCLLHNAAPQ